MSDPVPNQIDYLSIRSVQDAFAKAQRSHLYYSRRADRTRFWFYGSAWALLILSIASPLVVVTATTKAAESSTLLLFGMNKDILGQAAIVVSILLALVEGGRRMFRPEERWATCYVCMRRIEAALRKFELAVENIPEDDPPPANKAAAVRAAEILDAERRDIEDKEATEFFGAVQAYLKGKT